MTVGLDDFIPAIGAAFGLSVCLFGGRFTRLYCFVLGFLLGTSAIYWIFESQIAIRHGGVPFIVGLLVSLVGGVLFLLLHMLSCATILGWTIGSILMVLDNGFFLTSYRPIVYGLCLLGALAYTFRHPNQSMLVMTASSGALILTLSIDAYASRSFGASIFQDTFLEYPLDVEYGVARCFSWKCWVLIPFFFICTIAGFLNQYYSHHLRLYEQSWPLLFITPKRGNFSLRTPMAKSLLQDQLMPEDRNYTITNYSSYEQFHALQQQQQQAAAAAGKYPSSSPTAVAVEKAHTVGAAPELGSAHADDKVAMPPVARATFNFLEVKRLPPQSQYLYMVVQNSFQGLMKTYGFQQDNMQNQYEHMLFLLSNYQSKPNQFSSNTTTTNPSSGAGSNSPSVGPIANNGDYISQLHDRLFTNYRDWVKYINAGGNSAMGGSAISHDIVPLITSAISDSRVDKNTTDAKIEEMCLWLLVWGEAGSLRHMPECMIYIFHHLCKENRVYQERFGAGFLDTPASTSVAGGLQQGQWRPVRTTGDFLKHVIRPLYAVVSAENSKPDGVRRNYDDLNEFFWRKSCLQYSYCEKPFRVDPNADIEGAASGSSSSSVSGSGSGGDRKSVSIAAALKVGKKSFLEKRSWLHPCRSFMRLFTFYGVAFHLLVCISYIHYMNIPLLGDASNKILASFVISAVGWSVLKELVEIWAQYGIISESIWNTIGFVLRLSIKSTFFLYLICFYMWSMENDNPVVRDQYYTAYIFMCTLWLIPFAIGVFLQLFPNLANKIQSLHLPFVDELSKFWYPIQKIYVGHDIHEPERDIYKYQVFWVVLLLWKMYMSLLFQISPLIEPTVDLLKHIHGLSLATPLWIVFANYCEIVLLWLPFVLVYMFDTIIWYFLWQAIVGILVGMNSRLGEIREFDQLVRCFQELPAQFDRKIIYSKQKKELVGSVVKTHSSKNSSNSSSLNSSPIQHRQSAAERERESLLAVNNQGHLVANTGSYQNPTAGSGKDSPNMSLPVSNARGGRRASLSGAGGTVVSEDPFRNRAWENFAVCWCEIIEDLRVGDLISDAERSLLRFRFDTGSEKEYYLPLFLMVGHVDASIEICVGAHQEWKEHNTKLIQEGGVDSEGKARREKELLEIFMSNHVRRECVSEVWGHVEWLLTTLLGERHTPSLKMAFSAVRELLLTHVHVLRGTNLSNLPKVKSDLLNLVRGLRIASASYATLKLQEAERRSEEDQQARESEETERLEREQEEAEVREMQERRQARRARQAVTSGSASAADDEKGDADSDESSSSSDEEGGQNEQERLQRKRLLRETERSLGGTKTTLARAREFNLNSMLKESPSVGTLNMLEKIRIRHRHRSAAFVQVPGKSEEDDTGYLILHISLIRDQISALLNSLAGCLDVGYNKNLDVYSNHSNTGISHPDVGGIVAAIKAINMETNGFMWDGTYAGKQIHTLLKHSKTSSVLSNLHSLMTIASIDAEPKSLEAVRRLLFFANSLFMDLPVAPSIRAMKSLTTLTPFHSEDIIYSYSDLEKKTEDGVSVFFYLQTIYPSEWKNFLQRCGISEDAFNSRSGGNILSSNKKWNLEARLWATMRGQTLGRTVDGMMLYEKALRLLHKLEEVETTPAASTPSGSSTASQFTELDDVGLLIQTKYQYVISCQVYGKQKRENDPKAADIEFLLHKYPSVRVAYIDTVKVATRGANGQTVLAEEFYSVLIKSERNPLTGVAEIKEIYRVQLPGNPVLGEGKPENQNHAIIFTRGEFIQTIDMNQSNYFEEALKMRNLLEEFNVAPSASQTSAARQTGSTLGMMNQSTNVGEPLRAKHVGIVGFREHIYTGGLSSIANFMALQEGSFVTQGQRVLDNPLRVRFHYGHPDLFDKLFFMSRGGVSKASRGINLSEDIFAGFNSVLRGGSVKFREYISCGKGRDVGLQQLFKFEAKLAQGNSMQSISRDIYRIANTVDFFRLCSFFFGGVGFYITNCLTIWALYLFIYSRLILAGFRLESLDSFSGADTISYWFGMVGFLLTIPVFATIGLEKGFRKSLQEVAGALATGATLYYLFQIGTKHHFMTQTMLAGGAKYRPTGRGFVTRHEDFSEIFRFHASSHFYRSVEMLIALLLYRFVIPPTYDYSLVTWAGWLIVIAWLFGPFWFNPLQFDWEKTVQDFQNFAEWMDRKEGDGDHAWRAWWKEETSFYEGLDTSARISLILLQVRYVVVAASLLFFVGASKQQALVAGLTLAVFLLSVVFVRTRVSLDYQYSARSVKAVVVVGFLFFLFYLLEFAALSPYEYFQYFIAIVAWTYVFHAFCNMNLMCGFKFRFLLRWFKFVDWMLAGFIFAILGILAVTVIPGAIQTRLMFHNAFSRGVLIDKLLRTRPDDDEDGGKGGKKGGGGNGTPTSKDGKPAKGPFGGRRRTAGRPESPENGDGDSPDAPGASLNYPNDLDAFSFIERRGPLKKKLHPSKQEEQVELEHSNPNKKNANVSFGPPTTTGGPRKAPSISNLDDLLENEAEDIVSSPTPKMVIHPQSQQSQQSTPQSSHAATPVQNLPATGSYSHHVSIVPGLALNARPMGAAASNLSVPSSRSAGNTPVSGPTQYPTYQPIHSPASNLGVGMVRSQSDQPSPISPVMAPAFSLTGTHGAPVSISSSSSGRGSPAPSSPQLGASAPVNRRSDRLVHGLPNQAKTDERPIPKTVVGQSSAAQPFPATTSGSISPLNPRRG